MYRFSQIPVRTSGAFLGLDCLVCTNWATFLVTGIYKNTVNEILALRGLCSRRERKTLGNITRKHKR